MSFLANLPGALNGTIIKSMNERKLKRPFKPYINVRDPPPSSGEVHPCPVNLLVRNLQHKKQFAAQLAQQQQQLAQAKKRQQQQQSGWNQASVRRQAITLSVQPTNQGGEQPRAVPRAVPAPSAPSAPQTDPLTAGPSPNSLNAALLRKNRPLHRPIAAGSGAPHHAAAAPAAVPATSGHLTTAGSRQAAAAHLGASLAATMAQHRQAAAAAAPHSALPNRGYVTQVQVRTKRPRETSATVHAPPPAASSTAVTSSQQIDDPIVEAPSGSPQPAKRARHASPSKSPPAAAAAASSSYQLRSPPPTARAPVSAPAAIRASPRNPPPAPLRHSRAPSPTHSVGSHGSLPSRAASTSSACRSLNDAWNQPAKIHSSTAGRFGGAAMGSFAFAVPLRPTALPHQTPGQILALKAHEREQAQYQANHPHLVARTQALIHPPTPNPFAAAASSASTVPGPPRSDRGALALQKAREAGALKLQRDAQLAIAEARKEIDAKEAAESAGVDVTDEDTFDAPMTDTNQHASSSVMLTPPRPPSIASPSQRNPSRPNKRKSHPTNLYRSTSQNDQQQAKDEPKPMDTAEGSEPVASPKTEDEEDAPTTRSGRKRVKRS